MAEPLPRWFAAAPSNRGPLMRYYRTPALAYVLHVRCAWCGAPIDVIPTSDPRQDGVISHGMCPICAAEMRRELSRLGDEEDA